MPGKLRELRIAYKDRVFDITASYHEVPHWAWVTEAVEINESSQLKGKSVDAGATAGTAYEALAETVKKLVSGVDLGEL